jgi:hypothetical protein
MTVSLTELLREGTECNRLITTLSMLRRESDWFQKVFD